MKEILCERCGVIIGCGFPAEARQLESPSGPVPRLCARCRVNEFKTIPNASSGPRTATRVADQSVTPRNGFGWITFVRDRG